MAIGGSAAGPDAPLAGISIPSRRAKASRYISAERRQLNLAACTFPFAIISARSAGLSRSEVKRSIHSSGFVGEAYSAASPHTSGRLAQVDETTGQPRAMASNGGNPNPSMSDGNARQRDVLSSIASSSSDSAP